jgi:hypothetical protein
MKIIDQFVTNGHARYSFIKSAIRIIAGVALACQLLFVAGLLLIVAEVVGVIEELV